MWLAKKQKMLQVLEDAYPNSVNTPDLLRLEQYILDTTVLFTICNTMILWRWLVKRWGSVSVSVSVSRFLWCRWPFWQHREIISYGAQRGYLRHRTTKLNIDIIFYTARRAACNRKLILELKRIPSVSKIAWGEV